MINQYKPNVFKVLVVTPTLGSYSEVWLWRQIVGFKRSETSVLTWEYLNQDAFPIKTIPFENMQTDFNKKHSIVEHLFIRFHGLIDLNFCGPSKFERRTIFNYINKIKP